MSARTCRLLLALLIVLALPPSIHSQRLPWEALTNADVVQLVRDKVPAEEIIARIQSSRCHFDITPTVLRELKYQGVPEQVVKAMADAPYGTAAGGPVNDEPSRTRRTDGASSSIAKDELTNESHAADGASSQTVSPLPPQIPDTVQTQTFTPDLVDEITLGYSERRSILSQYAIVRGTRTADLAQLVFTRLRASASFNGAPNLPYDVEVIERSDPNAFATMGGHVYVTSGLAELLGDDVGLWAAVEGHEIAHNIYRHGYKKYLRELELQRQINYWRYRISLGDQSANWGLIAAVAAGKLINNKLERDDENDADKLGMLMMVEAGYHPDFAINLFRILKGRVGDQSKFGALFSGHPRFITREEHIRKLYPEALARFRFLWPDAATSPGGSPPIIGTVVKVSSKKDKTTRTVLLRLSYSIRNAKNEEIDAVFFFSQKGQAVPSLDPAFQGKNGALIAIRQFKPTADEEYAELEFNIPTAALGISQKKLKARGCLVRKEQLLQCSKDFDVSFPDR